MPAASYPKPAIEVISILADMFRLEVKPELIEVCESAHVRIDEVSYDNWNGGTSTWVLQLEVPVELFVSIKPRLPFIEAEIGAALALVGRQYTNHLLSAALIHPAQVGVSSLGRRMEPPDIDIRRVWGDIKYRLFLSHLSSDKLFVSKLKTELSQRGVSAFVAHEDIEPSLKWRSEIELALRSMNALAAILTPEFHGSNWTDQEIGWALGRNLLVLSVRIGSDPYGFFGENQGISDVNVAPQVIASEIVHTLLRNPQTHGEMRRSIVRSFKSASSWDEAKTLKALIMTIEDFTDEEKESLRKACEDNSQVKSAFGVSQAVLRRFA